LILEYLSSYCTCIDISGSQYTSLILAPNPSFYIGNFVEICHCHRQFKKQSTRQRNRNTFRHDANKKELHTNILPAIYILDECQQALVGSKEIPCHIIFDIKMDFTRKAR
jgi:hypothetical protein